jgi:transcriptional regulator with XRE-family HTH domain
MSPKRFAATVTVPAQAAMRGFWVALGQQIDDARRQRRWSTQRLADEAGISRSLAYQVRRGDQASIEAALRLVAALGLKLDFGLVDPHRRQRADGRQADVVHSAMGEWEAGWLRRLGLPVGLDEPYQHYQYAGRADVTSWDLDLRALLHIENRTRFPDFQEMAGAFNAKRAYLGIELADRLGIPGWHSETHVIAALWSAEVLHSLRLRTESFRALCPDGARGFQGWWAGTPPSSGRTAEFVVFDPLARGRQRPFVTLEAALAVRPRYQGYAEAAAALKVDRP